MSTSTQPFGSDATQAPAPPPAGVFARLASLLPGLLLLAVLGLAAKFLEQSINGYAKAHHLVFPNIEYVLWAIVLGLILGKLYPSQPASPGPDS